MAARGTLTPKQARFVRAYLKDFNATQAAIRAGYSKHTAYAIGAENLKKPQIVAALDAARGEIAKKSEMDADEWRARVARIARFDPRKLFDADGKLIPIIDLPDDAALCVGTIKVQREKTRLVENGQVVAVEESVLEVKPHEVLRALEMVGKTLGVLRDTVKHEGIDIAALLREGRARLGEPSPDA